MQPGAERHSGIELDNDIAITGLIVAPRRLNDDAPADVLDRKVLLPSLGPVLLVDQARREIANRAKPERLQMAQVGPNAINSALGNAAICSRDIPAHRHRLRRVDNGSKAIIDERERRLDRHAARAHARQDLAHLLHGFLIDAYRELQPGPAC